MTALRHGGRIFVSGANGFVGTHAVAELAEAGYEVVPILAEEFDLTRGWPPLDSADAILHLAGLAAVGPSFDEPQRYIEVNSSMVTHLGESVLRSTDRMPRIVVVSSGALYQAGESLVDEKAPLGLDSPYAVSKALVENQCDYYRNRGLDILIARPFNHIGPGQGPGFIVPDLAGRLRALAPGEELVTGNLDSSRDYTDVRDVVHAYRLLLELEEPAERVYNVASGVSRTGRDVLQAICAGLGIDVPPLGEPVRRRLDPDVVKADASRLRRETGWQPVVDFQDSVRDFLSDASRPA